MSASLATVAGAEARAQAVEPPLVIEESVIVVTAPVEGAVSFETQHRLSEEDVAALRAQSAAEVLRRLPSVHVPVNTRGESIAFMRNAAERQIGIFFDGAAINVPWDNRLDLQLFPAPLIGSVRASAGPVAPHYGVNSLGVVNLVPRRGGGEVGVEGGQHGLFDGMLFAPFSYSGADFALGGSYAQSDGDPLAEGARGAFGQGDDDVRSNTDNEIASVFGRARFEFAGGQVAISWFRVEGEQGIAPEPTAERFWRYADVEHMLGVVSVQAPLGAGTQLDGTFWVQDFGQTIHAFTDQTYSQVRSRQVDEDRTYGIREMLTYDAGIAKFVGSFSVTESRHDQRDIAYTNGLPPPVLPAELAYRQRNWSLGAELEIAAAANLVTELAAGYDLVEYIETGDKPPRENFEGPSARVGVIWASSEQWRLRAAVGYKVRTPTMRELFGEAIGRFLLNPDLQPEHVSTYELGAEWRGERGGFYVIPFFQALDNTIDQRTVGSRRQRINLRGSEVVGVELGGAYQLDEFWTLSGSATFAEATRLRSDPAESEHMAEKPEILADVILAYNSPSGLGVSLEVEYLGRAYSADANGDLVQLDPSTQASIEISYMLAHGERGESEIYLRADNVTDELVLPQFDLPAPGRLVRAGLRRRW